MTRQSALQGVNAGYALQVQGQELSSECLGVLLRLLSSEEEEPRVRQAGAPALCEQ